MNKTLLGAILACAALSANAACMRCGPIQNVNEAPVPKVGDKALTADDVRKAIVRAGGPLGWQMNAETPGKIVGTLNVRAHQAVIEIPYSAKSYSIVYKGSTNLNAEEGQIHNNYNGWVKNLQKNIDGQLAAP